MLIGLNALETTRFGIGAARVIDVSADLEAIDAAAKAQAVKLLSCRLDVGNLHRVHALEAAGYQLMDTLVYCGRPLANSPSPRQLPDEVTCRPAKAIEAGAVGAIARVAFAGYMGHYHADSRLENTAADAVYVQWAETSTEQTSAKAPVLLAELNGQVAGFVALRRNSRKQAEIVLNAVHPDCQGRGLYTALVAYALDHAKAQGDVSMIVSTQINNYAVQRVWTRLGFIHEKSLYTFHKWL